MCATWKEEDLFGCSSGMRHLYRKFALQLFSSNWQLPVQLALYAQISTLLTKVSMVLHTSAILRNLHLIVNLMGNNHERKYAQEGKAKKLSGRFTPC